MNLALAISIIGAIVYGVARHFEGGNWIAELGKLAFFAGLLAYLLK